MHQHTDTADILGLAATASFPRFIHIVLVVLNNMYASFRFGKLIIRFSDCDYDWKGERREMMSVDWLAAGIVGGGWVCLVVG